jgi:hypothetical protein
LTRLPGFLATTGWCQAVAAHCTSRGTLWLKQIYAYGCRSMYDKERLHSQRARIDESICTFICIYEP